MNTFDPIPHTTPRGQRHCLSFIVTSTVGVMVAVGTGDYALSLVSALAAGLSIAVVFLTEQLTAYTRKMRELVARLSNITVKQMTANSDYLRCQARSQELLAENSRLEQLLIAHGIPVDEELGEMQDGLN